MYLSITVLWLLGSVVRNIVLLLFKRDIFFPFSELLLYFKMFMCDLIVNSILIIIAIRNISPLVYWFLIGFNLLFPIYVYLYPGVVYLSLLLIYYSSLTGIFVIFTLLQENYVTNSFMCDLLCCLLLGLILVVLCIIAYMCLSWCKRLLDYVIKMNSNNAPGQGSGQNPGGGTNPGGTGGSGGPGNSTGTAGAVGGQNSSNSSNRDNEMTYEEWQTVVYKLKNSCTYAATIVDPSKRGRVTYAQALNNADFSTKEISAISSYWARENPDQAVDSLIFRNRSMTGPGLKNYHFDRMSNLGIRGYNISQLLNEDEN